MDDQNPRLFDEIAPAPVEQEYTEPVPQPRPRRRRLSPEERRRRRRRAQIRMFTVLGCMVLVAGLLIFGVVKAVSFLFFRTDKKPAPTDPVTIEATEEVTEPTVDPVTQLQNIMDQAEALAATYDYEAACDLLHSYGSDWQEVDQLVEADAKYQEEQGKLVRWPDTTTIPHIFFHSLIVDTDRCFDGEYTEGGYNQYMATVGEFNAILEELYARGFVVVRLHDIAKLTTNEEGKQVYTQGDIYLPPDKKPIVISQDDVNYYEYMVDSDDDHIADAGGDGFATKLLVDENGRPTCEYITAQGETVYGDYDLAPLLETFIEKHPDFSYRGARAVLALTGYQGVFGYRTNPKWIEIFGQDAFDQACKEASEVAEKLKEGGWEIASHSFGHPAYGNISAESVIEDIQKWEDQVQPIVGDTDLFIYPYGSDISGVEGYSGPKYETMYAAGYRFFCNVDSSDYWVQIHDDYVRQGRRNIDGYRMWYNPELLDDLFDVDKIFDPARTTPVPAI